MDPYVLNVLQQMVTQVAQDSQRLLQRAVDQLGGIDWATGQVTINDPDAIRNAFIEVRGPEAGQVADGFIALLNDGFAPLDLGLGEPVGIPWRALAHRPTLAALNPEVWAQLGVTPGASAAEVGATLAAAFPAMPDYLAQDTMLTNLISWGTRPESPTLMVPAGDRVDRDPAESLPDPDGAPTSSVPQEVISRITDLAQAAADCLLNGQWSIETLAWFHVGPRVCLDRACADTLEEALWEYAGGTILGILTAAGAGAPAVLAAAGGWVGLAMLHFSIHWAALINLNKTENGVCLIHFFPWISPAFGGILNGYATGR